MTKKLCVLSNSVSLCDTSLYEGVSNFLNILQRRFFALLGVFTKQLYAMLLGENTKQGERGFGLEGFGFRGFF